MMIFATWKARMKQDDPSTLKSNPVSGREKAVKIRFEIRR
jgi:hypothetical protein